MDGYNNGMQLYCIDCNIDLEQHIRIYHTYITGYMDSCNYYLEQHMDGDNYSMHINMEYGREHMEQYHVSSKHGCECGAVSRFIHLEYDKIGNEQYMEQHQKQDS